jgi:uncharacterized protein (TIGR04255 family)
VTQIERNLPRKPLVEAILEIRWDLGGKADPGHPLFAGAMAGIVKDRYSAQERLPAAEIPDELSLYIVKFRMRPAVNGYPLIQAGPGIVTLNFTKEYSWDDFKSSALHLWDSLQAAYPAFNGGLPPRVNNVILKYINSFPLESASPELFARERLHTQFAFPEGVSGHETAGPPNDIALFANYPLKRGDTTATVKVQNGIANNVASMVWELTAEGRFPIPVDRETFGEWLDYSHAVVENWFFSLVEGSLLSDFRGGVSDRG